MEIIVRGKHFDVPGHVEERARRKFGRLDHYLPLLRDAVVEVDVAQERAKEPRGRYLVTVLVSGGGVHLRAEERAARLEMAVDQASRALTDQARRHKERLYGRGRAREAKEVASQRLQAAIAGGSDQGAAAAPDKVARVKRFAVKPMTREEAIEQMELLGHSFFLFHDAEIAQFALLYRRRTGDYGLIVPELL